MASTPDVTPSDIIVIAGPEQATVDPVPQLADAGLPYVVGAQAWQVFRASQGAKAFTDGRGWTYNHHIDLAVWKGRYYVGWNSCERDEDIWPSRELFSTSADGATWDPPRELFPQGVSTCLRMYFYNAPNGRMLAIAGLRQGTEEVDEELKGSLIVREIQADHALGRVHLLQRIGQSKSDLPMFDTSSDAAFVEACRHLLANTVYLEQQDVGRLLGERKMKWHDAANWPGGKIPGDSDKWRAGKAWSFFKRPDGLRVGISKMGFTTCSADDGKTWSRPDVPPTLITGKAKVWTQQTNDGRYALAYNPTTRTRYPLIVVSSDDGQHFSGMRIVHGELPIQRYPGRARSVGPQYTRGISEWSTDGSIKDDAFWLVYSMSKEDIWVSRVPLPITPDETNTVHDEFAKMPAGPIIPRWNTYRPRWADLVVKDGSLQLADQDPYDYAAAVRNFPTSKVAEVELTLTAAQTKHGRLEIDICAPTGGAVAVRLALNAQENVLWLTAGQPRLIGTYAADRAITIAVKVDATTQSATVLIDGQQKLDSVPLFQPAQQVGRVMIRTGEYRNIGGTQHLEDPSTDKPTAESRYRINWLRVTTKG